ncbi:acyl CoA:acetate/3-ketoacid CoA transferase [Rhizobium sp. BK181]|uniref:CoA-transferase n=1 Tax=Rhizobium sp. BK181 TaxID=2587072 RepID=UPI00161C3D60|nr:acyl CoA:acetate/3-ketoacid CoA transferase [Rhizobium sp. BK181]
MRKTEILSAAQAAELVNDEDTIVICGCENVLAPNTLLRALGDRYKATQRPRNLTEIHPIIVGMGPDLGLENLAHPGLIKRAIGSGYSFLKTSRYTELLKQGAFEAHVVPMGTLYEIPRHRGRQGLHADARGAGNLRRSRFGRRQNQRQVRTLAGLPDRYRWQDLPQIR